MIGNDEEIKLEERPGEQMETKRCNGCMKLKTQSPVCEWCGYDENTQNDIHQLPVGTVLKEQYRVGRTLGQGGFGITYLGWDLYLDIPVAIKEYYPSGVVMRDSTVTMDVVSWSGDEGARFRNNKERFLREAKMLARFSQVPEIVQVKNFFLANNTAYIVMEYVEGITLKEYVQTHGGKLGVQQTLEILRPVMEALCKVHRTGLVHRDISPDNIMMLPNGGVKLLDFGAVRDVGAAAADKPLTKSTEAILKQGYAPIEQYQKRGGLGPWTDVYAMCATIYFCLTGQVPPDAPERLLGYEELNLDKTVPELTPPQEKALEHGMELRAEERTASMEQLLQELFGNAAADPVQEECSDRIQTGTRPRTEENISEHRTQKQTREKASGLPRSRRLFWGALVSVLVLAAVGIGWLLVRGNLGTGTMDTANQVSGQCGDNLTWTLDTQTGVLKIEGTGQMDNYRSADIYREENLPYPPWQKYRNIITAVEIGQGVTSVGDCAFYGYDTISSLQLPSTVETVNFHAFWGCGILELSLPDGLREIGEGAFSFNPLAELVLPDSVEYVQSGAFDGIQSLKRVTIGPTTRLSSDLASPVFGGTPALIHGYSDSPAETYARHMGHTFVADHTSQWDASGQCGEGLRWYLNIDSGLLRISGTGAMEDYNGQWAMEEIHSDAWVDGLPLPPWSEYAEQILMVEIADGVTSIGRNAFDRCQNLRDVFFGNTLEKISFQAFLAASLEQVFLPDSVTEMESCSFNCCRNLWRIRLPETLSVLPRNAIAECENLQEIYFGPNTEIQIREGEIPFSSDDESLNVVTYYPNLTIVGLRGSYAERFAQEYGYSFRVGTDGFWADDEGQCGDNVYWFVRGGDTLVLYGTGETWLYRANASTEGNWPEGWLIAANPEYYQYRTNIRRLIVKPGVEVLNQNLFTDMWCLEEIDLGTVVSATGTFYRCGMETIELPETMETIGDFLFEKCSNLRDVTIQNGSRYVGQGIFQGCTSLENVWFSGDETIGEVDLFNPKQEQTFQENENLVFHVRHGSDAMRYAQSRGIALDIVN